MSARFHRATPPRASMRPRVFPAEDRQPSGHTREVGIASMRPRVFPAEDPLGRDPDPAVADASMRPRVFPAEDPPARLDSLWRVVRASMRPRVFPAEDAGRERGAARAGGRSRFNEAAGIPRGRPDQGGIGGHGCLDASMRPRVFPAEDASRPLWSCGHRPASMRPRVFPAEDPPRPSTPPRGWWRFNEAAGIPRGRQDDLDQPDRRDG